MNDQNPIQSQSKFKLTWSRPSRKEVVFLLKFGAASAPFALVTSLLYNLAFYGYVSRDFALVGTSALLGAFCVVSVIAFSKLSKL